MYNQYDRLVILGAGGHAKVCHEIAVQMDLWQEILILDDQPMNDYFEIEGPIAEWIQYIDAVDFFCGIGNNGVRKDLLEQLEERKQNVVTLVSPYAFISPVAQLATGVVIMPGVVMNPSVDIGKGCIINTGSTIDHDCQVGDYSHISPGCHLGGRVKIGNLSWVGIGSTIINGIEITDNVQLGSASNVVKDILDEGMYYGNPARSH